MEVARARHPGTPLLKRRRPVVPIHTCPCPQSLLRLVISQFPNKTNNNLRVFLRCKDSPGGGSASGQQRALRYRGITLCSVLDRGAPLPPAPRDLCIEAQIEPECPGALQCLLLWVKEMKLGREPVQKSYLPCPSLLSEFDSQVSPLSLLYSWRGF